MPSERIITAVTLLRRAPRGWHRSNLLNQFHPINKTMTASDLLHGFKGKDCRDPKSVIRTQSHRGLFLNPRKESISGHFPNCHMKKLQRVVDPKLKRGSQRRQKLTTEGFWQKKSRKLYGTVIRKHEIWKF